MSRRPRLLVLPPSVPYPPVSGGDIRVFQLLRRLSRSFDIHLMPYGQASPPELVAETGISASHHAASGGARPKTLRQQINFWRYAPHGMNLDVDPAYADSLTRLVRDISFDAVLIDHLYMMQYAPFVAGLPIFYSATDVETTKFERWFAHDPQTWKRRLLHSAQHFVVRRQEAQLAQRARVTFATSQADRDALAGLNRGGRFVVVPNGVDLEYFRVRSRETFEGPPIVFFVGTMYYKPNHDAARFLANEIFPLVRRDVPDAACHLAGKTDAHDYSALNRPSDGIVMHGFVEDIRPYLEKARVLAVPLFVGSGTRIKILEAMASGTPVVSSAIGAEGIAYDDGRNIIIANGATDTAAAVVRLFRDRELSARIGRAGRQLVEEKYSWDTSAEIVCEEIVRVLGASSSSAAHA